MPQPMKKYWLRGLLSGAILVLLLGSLLLKPSLLVVPLMEDPYIPFGNLLFWAAFIAFPVFLETASKGFSIPNSTMKARIFSGFKAAIIFGVLWWPVSYLLAGNFSNSFQNQEAFIGSSRAFTWFYGYSYFVVLFPIALWLMRAVLSLWALSRKK